MARLHDIVFDCRHPASLARFWAAVLDGYEVAPYDDAELERLRQKGIFDPEDDPSVLVQPADAGRPRFFFQAVPEPKATKNRVHVDLRTPAAAEIDRMVRLGATVVATEHRDDGVTWTLLHDPEGNEFCVDTEP